MNKRIGLILSIVVLLAAGGCNTGTRQRMNCICLIDYSGSLSEQTLHRYIEIISSDILKRLREKDRLVVLPIDEGAKTVAVKLVYEDLAEKKFSFSTDGYAHAKDSLDMRLRQFADQTGKEVASELLRQKTIREKYTYYSDIFSAIEQAAVLQEHNEAETFWGGVERFITGKKKIVSTNVIILFSDMIQESSETSFAGDQGCTDAQADSVIGKLRAENRIPDLHGCVIYVNGRTGKSNVQVDNIKNFWTRYFKEAGGELVAYDYDAGAQITSYLAQHTNQ
ncbi:MAG TPA: hypothetical protein VLX91_00795 [Candidatus Acidoferrales bacterium]|nr:hypothetical protein [Candidatus Acidoferrales bacterium]